MVAICRERDDQEGTKLFLYCLQVFTKMGSGGMSEDEDGVEKVVADRRKLEESVKLPMIIPFRHPLLAKLVAFMDKVPNIEKTHFTQSGKAGKRRVRDDGKCKVMDRKPPKGWPVSFFADGYLEALTDFQRAKLHVSEKEFSLY